MGNQPSTAKSGLDDKPSNNTTVLAEYINTIASELIRGQDFRDMKNLLDPRKCNDLVIMTADIFEKYLTGKEVEYLDHRIKDGVVDSNTETALTTDNIAFFKKKDLHNLDIDTRKSERELGTRKRRICIGIAKFYIKIAHVFAAIKTTINEEFIKESSTSSSSRSYNDYREGDYYKYYQKKYGGGEHTSARMSLCGRRLVSLLNDRNSSRGTVFSPEICSSEYKNRIRQLDDELGIPELESLYNNMYEYDEAKRDWKKQFSGRDKKNDEEYKKDLKALYNQITSDYTVEGSKNDSLPNDVNKFGDVSVPSYGRSGRCSKDDKSSLRNEILYKIGDQYVENPIIVEYTKHIKKMEDEIQKKHKELTDILKEIFKNKKDPETEKTEIVIDPELTFEKLQKIVEKTRKSIVQMYLDCDKNYKEGIKIYSQLVAAKIVEKAEESTNRILQERDEIVSTPEEPDRRDYREKERESDRYSDRERESETYYDEPKKKSSIFSVDRYDEDRDSYDDRKYEDDRQDADKRYERQGMLREYLREDARLEQERREKERKRRDDYYGGKRRNAKKSLKKKRLKNKKLKRTTRKK